VVKRRAMTAASSGLPASSPMTSSIGRPRMPPAALRMFTTISTLDISGPTTDHRTLLARADPQAAIESAVTTYGPVRGATMAGDEWVTVVRAERDYGGAPPARSAAGLPGAWTLFLIVFGLVTAAGAAHLRFSSAWPARVLAAGPRIARAFRRDAPERATSRTFSAHNLSNAGAAVAAFLVQTETAVAHLKGAGPLRDVLQSEQIHHRLLLAPPDDAAVGLATVVAPCELETAASWACSVLAPVAATSIIMASRKTCDPPWPACASGSGDGTIADLISPAEPISG